MLVTNEAGVAARLTSLYARRGYNIDSFTASPTNDPKLTRITLVLTGDDRKFNQIFTQTAKQEFVHSISLMEEHDLYRELLLLKIKASKKERSEIKEIVDIYRGRIVDLSWGAARELGMLGQGIAKVTVEVLPKKETTKSED